jgi:hypothetical protein
MMLPLLRSEAAATCNLLQSFFTVLVSGCCCCASNKGAGINALRHLYASEAARSHNSHLLSNCLKPPQVLLSA